MKISLLTVAAVALAAGCASEPDRAPRTMEDLMAARQADDLARANSARHLSEQLMQRAERKAKAAKPDGPRPTIDMLVISGGGARGRDGARWPCPRGARRGLAGRGPGPGAAYPARERGYPGDLPGTRDRHFS